MKKTIGRVFVFLVSGALLIAASGAIREARSQEAADKAGQMAQWTDDDADRPRLSADKTRFLSPDVFPDPPPVELRVSGAEKPIELRELVIESEIAGGFAQTTVDMRFYNPNARVLEGELQFPLADGQSITGFALSMKGEKGEEVMREAVSVPKNKGRQVFEAVIRQQIDPALLEAVQGQHFKLRVYPLPPGETRRARLTYRERLPKVEEGGAFHGLYRLPLAYALKPERITLSLRAQGAKAPTLAAAIPGLPLDFRKTDRGWRAQASARAREGALSGQPLRVKIPAEEVPAYLGERLGETYFYAELPAPAGSIRPQKLPGRVALFWDASLSGSKRRHDKEFAFLEAFFAKARDVTVRLQKLRDVADTPRDFVVKNGDWSALKKDLADTVYDGAPHLAAMRFTDAVDINLGGFNLEAQHVDAEWLQTLDDNTGRNRNLPGRVRQGISIQSTCAVGY